MAGDRGAGMGRPSRNMMWLMGLALAALLIGLLATTARKADGTSGGQIFTSESRSTPTGMAVPEASPPGG